MKNQSNQELINWLENQKNKDKLQLEREKEEFVKRIKKEKKENISNLKPKKLTLWQRIKKVLMG
jgi:hypothetical protein